MKFDYYQLKEQQSIATAKILSSCPFGLAVQRSNDYELDQESPSPTTNAYAKPSRVPWFYEVISQKIQMYFLSHNPRGLIARMILFPFSLIEGLLAAQPNYLSYKRAAFGEHFCCAGQVVLGTWDEVKYSLTTPQARTFRLGTIRLSESRVPKANGQSSVPVTLSQQGAGGDGSLEAYRGAIQKYLIKGAIYRQDDQVAQDLMNQLVTDYKAMDHELGGEFFHSSEGGMLPFLNKYAHYCLWGLDPNDKDTVDALYTFYYGGTRPPIAKSFRVVGFVYKLKDFWRTVANIRDVEKIYEKSPALRKFISSEVGITKREMASLMLPMMAIGVSLVRFLLAVAMGEKTLTEFKEGVDTSKIKPTEVWDKLDLNDVDEVQRYLLECGRLNPPVGHSHRVAIEDFTVEMMGKERTFPKGTIINIPLNMSCVNKNVYGDTVFEFDHKRKNLCEASPIFHSVGMIGRKNTMRICPGHSFSMRMMIEIIQKAGETRRE